MKRLELDYLQPAREPRLAVYILAIVAVGFAADVALRYHSLRDEVAAREARLAKRSFAQIVPESAPALTSEERAFARDTMKRLATPWDRLFQALEAAQTGSVALLAVEPDVENRVLGISGEAQDYLAVLSYVANLSEQKALRQVHLVRHEVRKSSHRPLVFHISVAWGEER